MREKWPDRLKAPIANFDKRRLARTFSEVNETLCNYEGKTAILIDDIIDTAGNNYIAANALVDERCFEVYACCTHPVIILSSQLSVFKIQILKKLV